MQLKELEIRGFKSFPDKTIINFKDGITGVVGPNGSGKSNISDAIRWVLGEQSVKSLRGSKMEDIIFTGTSTRKPLGYAEVSITFDNVSGSIPLEYEEVAFTRRVFRSGESEYYINKNSCRLKDIRELLMDTGIGKEGYSIIGQGKIDEILSSRTEDRRNIFEEAAGIVKYKSRKEESERKLERTEENLTRVQDLVTELSKNERKLKKQAEKAKEYKNSSMKLREIELEIYSYNIYRNQKKIEDIIIKIEEKSNLLNIEEEKIKEKRKNLYKVEKEIERLEEKIRDNQDLKYDINSKFELEKSNKTLIEERINFVKSDIKRLKATKERILEDKDKLEKETLKDSEDLKKLKDKISIIKKDLDLEISALELEQEKIVKEEILYEEKKDKLIEFYNKISQKRTEYNNKKSFLENVENRLIELNELKNENIEDKHKLESYIEELSRKREKSLEEIDLNNKKIMRSREELSQLEEKYSKIIKEVNDVRINLEKTLSNYNLYLNMEKNYEGYYKGVKNLLKSSNKNPKIKSNLNGIVAELMSVDPKYEVAITSALGGRAQNIIVPTQNSGKYLIEKSRRKNYGRITCLPLDTIRGNKLKFTNKERDKYKIIGVASELIEYDEKYKQIYESLLGRTVVVADMDDGINLSNGYSNRLRIVTLKGDIINPGGAMTGGSIDNSSSNIISRKNKIEELAFESNKYKNKEIKLKEEEEKIKFKIEEITIEIEEKLKEERTLEINLAEDTNILNNKKLEYDKAVNDLKGILLEKENISKNIDVINKEINILSIDIDKLEKEIEKTRNFIKEGEENLKIIKENNKASEKETTTKRIEFNSIKDNFDNKKKEKERKLLEIKTSLNRISKLEVEIKNKEVEESNLTKKIDLLRKDIKDYYTKSQKVEKKLLELREKLKDKKDEKIFKEKDLEQLDTIYKEIETKLNDLKIEKTKYEVKKEATLENLYENYSLAPEKLNLELSDDFDIKTSQEKADKLKVGIKKLGNVNLNAISEYSTLKERLEFILQQKEDLIKAKKDLLKVIKDMEKKMKSMFIKSFNEINKNFKIIFKTLFNGGEARLILEDEEDILKTGIGIEAKPPGKKLQNLESLSGGEKSLVAVSLLFAILKMKPSPFCVLDEIDAALDEANIGRYTSYLKEMSKETQFIIITHRKKTMEIVDTLYGITMEEEGVSKLVSVELTEFQKEVI